MVFTQFIFLGFFAAVYCLYWALQNHFRTQKLVLLIASYVFYGWWDWRFLALISACTSLDWFVAQAICACKNHKTKRAVLVLSIFINLGILAYFKYLNFFLDSAVTLLNFIGFHADFPLLKVLLPVGISFFTFQSMSYTIDVYRGDCPVRRSYLDFALFVAFFPQLVAGPIVRARDFLYQLDSPRTRSMVKTRQMLALFAIGYIKKACMADPVALAIDPVFTDPTLYSTSSLWLAYLLYGVQIYCDFSGYTDMAIATAGLLGYELLENFYFPYFAHSIQQFWQRWHISLSTWLKDYLYISLGGNRHGSIKTYRNLFLTMLIGGLWHGASWNFVFWGAAHGLALAGHRLMFQTSKGRPQQKQFNLEIAIGTVSTFLFVHFCWIFFRAPDFQVASKFLKGMFMVRSQELAQLPYGWFAIFAGLALIHFANYKYREKIQHYLDTESGYRLAMLFGGVTVIAILFTLPSAAPFIYFQF